VEIITNTSAKRVLIEDETRDKVAMGVETVDGRIFRTSKEVILACGSYGTPKILLLSGIGPDTELSRHGIPQQAELPVGENLHEHCVLAQFWRVRDSDKGLAFGPKWTDPSLLEGSPVDWMTFASSSIDELAAAVRRDEQDGVVVAPLQQAWARTLPAQGRATFELLVIYAPNNPQAQKLDLSPDGSIISTCVSCNTPTSRGRVTLSSADPLDPPVMDPNFYATEADRVILRSGIRLGMAVARAMKLADGTNVVLEEIVPPGMEALSPEASDDDIDTRVRAGAQSFFHAGGGASMGEVVDTQCKVIGMKGLRVADLSVMPVPNNSHYQYPTYAVAEKVADLIIKEHEGNNGLN
jgi:choline dehydrogenase-like flavoprotein